MIERRASFQCIDRPAMLAFGAKRAEVSAPTVLTR